MVGICEAQEGERRETTVKECVQRRRSKGAREKQREKRRAANVERGRKREREECERKRANGTTMKERGEGGGRKRERERYVRVTPAVRRGAARRVASSCLAAPRVTQSSGHGSEEARRERRQSVLSCLSTRQPLRARAVYRITPGLITRRGLYPDFTLSAFPPPLSLSFSLSSSRSIRRLILSNKRSDSRDSIREIALNSALRSRVCLIFYRSFFTLG